MTRVNDLIARISALRSARGHGEKLASADADGTVSAASPTGSPLESGDSDPTLPPIFMPSSSTPMDQTTSPAPFDAATDPQPTAGAAPAPQGGDPFHSADAARLAELEARHSEVSDAYLRAKAEAENIRRRADDEMAKARKFAVETFAEHLLPVKDSLEAAIAIPAATPEQLLEGVHATLRQLAAALERNKVLEINPPASTRFDPHQHQAISVVPADQEPNTVVTVLQKGYSIAERVLRPALVTVSAAK